MQMQARNQNERAIINLFIPKGVAGWRPWKNEAAEHFKFPNSGLK